MANDIALEEDLYSWLTEDLGWTPQEAYQEISADTSDEREPEPPVKPKSSPDEKLGAVLLANEAMKAEEASLESRWREAGRQGITRDQAKFINQDQKFGQVMPTSKGFMYVGKPVTPPAGWTSPQAQAYDRGVAGGLISKPSVSAGSDSYMRTPEYQTFAAQQGYRQDIERGVPATEALQKWIPMGLLRGLSAGAQTSISRPVTATQPRVMNVSGVGYEIDPVTRTWTQKTTPKPAEPSRLVTQEIGKSLDRENRLRDDLLTTPDVDQRLILVNEIAKEQARRKKLQSQEPSGPSAQEPAAPKPAAVTAPTATPTEKPVREVIRRTKDGRAAVFDADTKQFIRYAN